MSADNELDQIRAAAEGVLERARNDEAYRASLVEDPVSALVAAGVPQDAAERIGLNDWRDENAETEGFQRWNGCDRWTCVVSICPNIPYTNACGLTTNKSAGAL